MAQELKKGKLEELPENENEFWDGADTNRFPRVKRDVCEHYFIHKSGIEIICKYCNAGFFLAPGWSLEDGHIYKSGKLVV